MVRKKKSNTPKTTKVPTTETIGVVPVVVEEVKLPAPDIETTKRKRAKKPDTTVGEKFEIMPQTYIEDTFDINNPLNSHTTIIDNPVKEKVKRFITKEELVINLQFKNKVDRAIKDILFKKSFSDLLDLSQFSKMNRTYFIDEETDEVDVILGYVVDYFKKRLAKTELTYQNFKIIDAYLESIKTLYNRFKNEEGVMKGQLKTELETLTKLDGFIRYHLF